jgi:hypothetical protein
MPVPVTNVSNAMNELVALNPKITLTSLGLDVHERLTLEEWRDIGARIGAAMRSVAFVIGDWLVYADGRDGQITLWDEIPKQDRVPGWAYAEAAQLTGMDVSTLHNYAYVARHVPQSLRNERLSWEHHKKVAKLKDDAEKLRWLRIAVKEGCNGEPISTRRLARSIQAGRLLAVDELDADDAERGIENVHPYVNRICAFIGKLRQAGWFHDAPPEKRAALKRDLQPVVDLYAQL